MVGSGVVARGGGEAARGDIEERRMLGEGVPLWIGVSGGYKEGEDDPRQPK